MKPNLRRNLTGIFAVLETRKGAWSLTRREAPPALVYLKGDMSDAGAVLNVHAMSNIEIEWRDDGVLLNVESGGRRRALNVASAIVHEPLADLYDALPLAAFDGRAKRFWRRVFFLVRIPGGRRLLGALARSRRRR
jgi:hypothetical protein